MKKFYGLSLVLATLFLAGCATKGELGKADLKERGCEAFNFTSLLLSKAKAAEFIDKRTQAEKNFQNGLWTAKEYCDMSELTLTELLVEYGKKTDYSNLISVRSGSNIKLNNSGATVIEIEGSNMQYVNDRKSFNYVATDDKNVISFKDGDEIKLDGKKYRIYNKQEYKNDKEAWIIEIIEMKDKMPKSSLITIKENKFVLGNYKVIF